MEQGLTFLLRCSGAVLHTVFELMAPTVSDRVLGGHRKTTPRHAGHRCIVSRSQQVPNICDLHRPPLE